MAQVSFKKGLLNALPTTYSAGTFYVTTDEKAMYLDIDNSTRIRLGDFQEFANLDALKANTNPSTTALYYVADINCMAKWNGAEYVQVNPDTGAVVFEVVGEGNAVTAASYDAATRKLTLTKGETFATKAELDTLDTFVGDIPEGYTETNVIAYINKKAEETLASAQGGSSETAASVKAALDTYKASNDARVEAVEKEVDDLQAAIAEDGSVTTAIAAAQTKADSAYELAEGKATMEEVNTAIAGAGHAVKSDVDAAIDGINAKIGTVPADSNVMAEIAKAQTAATYNDEEVRGLISDNADAIKAISDDYLKAEDKTELTDLITAEQDRAEGIEQDHETRIAAMEAFWDGADNSAEAIDKLKELQNYIASDETGAAEMAGNIQANTQAIAKETEDRIAADNALGVRIDTLSGVVDGKAAQADLEALDGRVEVVEGKVSTLEGEMDVVEGKVSTLEGKVADLENASATHATKDELRAVSDVAEAAVTVEEMNAAISAAGHASQTDLTTHINDEVKHITADERTAWNKVISDLSDHKSAYDAKVAELEGVDTAIRGEFAAADSALKTELQGYADQAEADAVAAAKTETETQVGSEKTAREAADTTLQGNIDTVSGALNTYKTNNDAAVALKADASAVYTKDEVEAMFTWGEFDA